MCISAGQTDMRTDRQKNEQYQHKITCYAEQYQHKMTCYVDTVQFFVFPFIHLSYYLSPSVHLPVYLSVHLSVCPFIQCHMFIINHLVKAISLLNLMFLEKVFFGWFWKSPLLFEGK